MVSFSTTALVHFVIVVAVVVCTADASIIFPRSEKAQYHHPSQQRYRRKHLQDIGKTRGVFRRTVAPPVAIAPGQSLAFTPIQAGGTALFAAALAFIGQKLRSESVGRALYFWINAGPIVAHYKFTRWYLSRTKAPLERRDVVYNSLHDRYCQKSLDIALHLKGLYAKIAQVVSSRPDFVPPQYIELFSSVQDAIPQWPIDAVTDILDRTLESEYGLSCDEVFEDIEADALGSASIGQVHKATLRDNFAAEHGGRKTVAIKVMHPGAKERFSHDFQVFRWLCKVALSGWEPILDEFYRQIMTEFDYRREAESLRTVRDHIYESQFSRRVTIPEPYPGLCTKELLVMEMLNGKKLSDAIEDDLALALGGDKSDAIELIKRKRLELILGKDKMESLGYPSSTSLQESFQSLGIGTKVRLFKLYRRTQKLIDLLIDVQGHQIFSHGVFNGDPHPGNVMRLDDNKLGLIDYGQTKRIADNERVAVARVVNAIGNGANVEKIADEMRSLGFQTRSNRDEVLAKYASLFFDSDLEGKKLGCATPQMYFALLTRMDPLVHVPDAAIFVARGSFLLRGMGTVLDKQVHTSARWKKQAKLAIEKHETTQ